MFRRFDWLYGRPGESHIQAHHDARNVINRIRVRGGLSPNPVETIDTFDGTTTQKTDGSRKIFQLTHRWVREITSVTVGGTLQTFGTAWWDATGYQVYINYPAGIIYFTTAPGNGVQVKVYYTYHTEVYYGASASPSAGIPWSETEIEDRSITSLTEAELLAAAVLQEYGTQIVVGSFLTNKLGLEPGMQIEVTDPVLGLSGNYTIRKVTTEIDKAGTGVIANVQFGGRETKLSWLVNKLAPNMRAGAYGYYLKMAADQGASNSEKVTDTAVSYSAKSSDSIVAVTDTSAARTITLPNAATVGKGRTITVKDTSGGAGTNNVTLSVSGGGTIDGSASQKINVNYGAYKLYSDGANWKVLSDTNLVAKDGTIKGTLTVGSGATTIIIDGVSEVIRSSNYSAGSAGWKISSDGSAEFNNVIVRGALGSVMIGNGIEVNGDNATETIESTNYSGNTTGWSISASGVAVFNQVTARGAIYASSGTVGGWTIGASGIYTGTYDADGYTASGITISASGGIHAPNFYIDSSGNLTCKNANVSGAIAATSGSIGGASGWVIGSKTLSAADGYLTLDANTPAKITLGSTSIYYDGNGGILTLKGETKVTGVLTANSTFYHKGSSLYFFNKGSAASQYAHIANASTSHAITDPADTPATADALRDDLVTNTVPAIETALNTLGGKLNGLIAALESYGLLAAS